MQTFMNKQNERIENMMQTFMNKQNENDKIIVNLIKEQKENKRFRIEYNKEKIARYISYFITDLDNCNNHVLKHYSKIIKDFISSRHNDSHTIIGDDYKRNLRYKNYVNYMFIDKFMNFDMELIDYLNNKYDNIYDILISAFTETKLIKYEEITNKNSPANYLQLKFNKKLKELDF